MRAILISVFLIPLMLYAINAEAVPKRGYRFEKTSLFPHIDLVSLFEMEFKISEVLHIPLNFDDMDFLEFSWMYRRVLEKIKKQQDSASNNMLPGLMRG